MLTTGLLLAGCDKLNSFTIGSSEPKKSSINLVCDGIERDFSRNLNTGENVYYGAKRPVTRTYIFEPDVSYITVDTPQYKEGGPSTVKEILKIDGWRVNDDGTLVMESDKSDEKYRSKHRSDEERNIKVNTMKIDYSTNNKLGYSTDVSIDRYSGAWTVEKSFRAFNSSKEVTRYDGIETNGKCIKVADKKF